MVSHFFEEIESRGHVYQTHYEGWYCISDETFLTNKEIEKTTSKSGEITVISKESGHTAEWNSETNYMFKLSKFQDDLLHWLREKDRVVPSRFQEELKLWVSSGLHDLSISRPRNRVTWGIPLPNDEEHTIYVWLDALANYLTVAGYPKAKNWPPNLQVIGKDILRFHGIYWPALLIAANLEPPHRLLVHSHWKVDGIKMSKSLGNVVCPTKLYNKFGSDAVRYVLLKCGVFHSDGSWSEEPAVHCANSDLANTVGNLLRRILAPSLNPTQSVPKLDEEFVENSSSTCQLLLQKINKLHDQVGDCFMDYNFSGGINTILNMAYTANLFIEEEKPWKLKGDADRRRLESILYIGMVAIRSAAIALQPIVPLYAEKLLTALGIPVHERSWSHLKNNFHNVFHSSTQIKSIIPFERIKS